MFDQSLNVHLSADLKFPMPSGMIIPYRYCVFLYFFLGYLRKIPSPYIPLVETRDLRTIFDN